MFCFYGEMEKEPALRWAQTLLAKISPGQNGVCNTKTRYVSRFPLLDARVNIFVFVQNSERCFTQLGSGLVNIRLGQNGDCNTKPDMFPTFQT